MGEEQMGNENVGFSFFGKLNWKKIKQVSRLRKMDWKGIKNTAKTIGPAVATVYPPAGAAIYGGLAIEKALKKGDKKALANMAITKLASERGSPTARLAMDIMQTARNVRGHKQGIDLLSRAKKGDVASIRKISNYMSAASKGNIPSAIALDRLESAAKGFGYYKTLMKKKKKKKIYYG